MLTWLALYFGTRFSLDATGRYSLPLYPVLFITTGLFLERLYRWRRPAAIGLLTAVLAFNLAAHVKAIQRVPPGITAQMNPTNSLAMAVSATGLIFPFIVKAQYRLCKRFRQAMAMTALWGSTWARSDFILFVTWGVFT